MKRYRRGKKIQSYLIQSITGCISLILISSGAKPLGDVVTIPFRQVASIIRSNSLGALYVQAAVEGKNNTLYTLEMPVPALGITSVVGKTLSYTRVNLAALRLLVPEDIAIDELGRLYVLDAARGAVIRFVVRAKAITSVDTIPVPDGITAICIFHDQLVAYSRTDDHPLHVLNNQGTDTRSFGPERSSNGSLRNRVMQRGNLVCSAKHDMLLTTSRLLGTISAYSATGTPLWSHLISTFKQVRLSGDGENSFTISSGPDGSDEVIGAAVLVDGTIAVQVGRKVKSHADAQEMDGVRTYMFDGKTGRQLAMYSDAPERLVSSRSTEVYSVEPYPKEGISLWQYTGRP